MASNTRANQGYPAASRPQQNAQQNGNIPPSLQMPPNNPQQSHGYSRSHPSLPQFMRFPSSPVISYHDNPISHFSSQYSANQPNMNFMYQHNLRHAVQHSGGSYGPKKPIEPCA